MGCSNVSLSWVVIRYGDVVIIFLRIDANVLKFRMHSSTKVDVFLRISSNPIIEHCQQIRFANYVAGLLPEPLRKQVEYPGLYTSFH